MDDSLLEILGCPLDKSRLDLDGDRLTCRECGRVYEIIDGIPQMLVKDYTDDSDNE